MAQRGAYIAKWWGRDLLRRFTWAAVSEVPPFTRAEEVNQKPGHLPREDEAVPFLPPVLAATPGEV
jgi:hypothetical protein